LAIFGALERPQLEKLSMMGNGQENGTEATVATDLTWDDAEGIGIQLAEKFPDQNPLELRFTDLHKMVTELPTFTGDPKASNEGKLEAIQMAWYDEFQENQT
jgi:FeS assembly protein IscX